MKTPKAPTYKRQKILLLLISLAGGKLTRTDYQKLLFLANQGLADPHYDFVPYRYGCFSFQAADDLETLDRLGWIEMSGPNICLRQTLQVKTDLAAPELADITGSISRFQNLRGKQLIRFIYRKHPYFAIHSEIAKEILDDPDYERILKLKADFKRDTIQLFTIGYEGLKFETYINSLIKNDIRLLCDVRQNPVSRKYGFSKKTLSAALPKLGIEYVHIPELGIISDRRRYLQGEDDFRELFKQYSSELPQRQSEISLLRKLIEQYKRVALTCFEREHSQCHRHCISEKLNEWHGIEVVHL